MFGQAIDVWRCLAMSSDGIAEGKSGSYKQENFGACYEKKQHQSEILTTISRTNDCEPNCK